MFSVHTLAGINHVHQLAVSRSEKRGEGTPDRPEAFIAQDKEKGHRFFGLKHYPNTKPGAGDGTGTPLWLCSKCYDGLSPHH